ncbi:MAG: hypothetical protein KC620_03330 [Myxococcales bacterium]|nr:hypothetical protein [Myxococcales bacterium]
MNVTPRSLGHLLAPLVLAALAVPATSCQDRDVGLSIRQVQPFLLEECDYSKDQQLFRSAGTVDLALANNYRIFALVTNNLLDVTQVKRFNSGDSRIDTNDIVLRSAIVEYTTLSSLPAQIQEKRRVPISGTVTVGGDLILGIEVLDPLTMAQLRDSDAFVTLDDASGRILPNRTSVQIIARIRMKGETLDGKTVESNEFLFPIEICSGCLISYPPALLQQRNGVLTCPQQLVDDTGTPIAVDNTPITCPAALGRDAGSVDCQTCQGIAVDPFFRQLCQPNVGF